MSDDGISALNGPEALSMMEAVIEARKDVYLEKLFRLLRQKSISAQDVGMTECAEMLRAMMQEIGISARLIETAGHPVVYGERIREGNSFTVLIYGHYDVQPAEMEDGWHTPPFEPTIRNGRIYCRGAGDNKGQLMAQLLGVLTYLDVRGDLPINVKFLFEGEEESGSLNLAQFVEEHRELLRSDLVYTSDGPLHETGKPVVLLGVRGMLYVELTSQIARWDNHSGNKGNIVPNPAWQLIELLQTMRDEAGNVKVKGFYDNITPPTDEQLDHLASLPYDVSQIAMQAGLDHVEMDAQTYYRRLMFEPTFNICGFHSGYGGAGSKTIIPSKAKVKIDIRLVEGQEPDDIYEKLRQHIQMYAPSVQISHLGDMRPSRTPLELPIVQEIIQAVERSYRTQPVILPSLGGSLPDYVWTKILGVPSVIVPYANSDEANHSPNENMDIENFFNGIRCTCHVIEQLGHQNSEFKLSYALAEEAEA